MRIIIFSAILLVSTFTSYGQKKQKDKKEKKDQWLVTAQMDTLYGKIFLETGSSYLADVARFRNDKNKERFPCHQLRSVHLAKDQDFEVLRIDQRYQFVQMDLKGKYFAQYLYKDASLGASAYFALKVLVNSKGEQFKVSNLTPRKKFAEYFSDCESVSEKIEVGEWKKKDLEKIFEAYDACIDGTNINAASATVPAQPSDEMDALISGLTARGLYEGDLVTMLEDIRQKLNDKKSIPNYLQQAVLEELKGETKMKEKFLTLIKK